MRCFVLHPQNNSISSFRRRISDFFFLMALFYQHNINETTRLGVWHITETEDFFLKEVNVQRTITHPHKRLQHLAGRYLLRTLFPDFPHRLILIADTRKPYLPDEQYHFSISHCGDYAAAIVSSHHRVGIDIEIPSYKVNKVRHKFLHPDEDGMIEQLFPGAQLSTEDNEDYLRNVTLLWSAKEAIFKWYGAGEVDFSEHIRLQVPGLAATTQGTMKASFSKSISIPLSLSYINFKEITLAWVNS